MSPSEPLRQITLDQVVAYNLKRARQLRGWTQAQAAEQLEPYLGELWSIAAFSAAERSFESSRIRTFSASQVLAFSLGFRLPIAWFYVPPTVDAEIGTRGTEGTISGRDLLWLVIPEADLKEDRGSRAAAFRDRLDELSRDAGFEPGRADLPAPLGLGEYVRGKGLTYADSKRVEELEREVQRIGAFMDIIKSGRIDTFFERMAALEITPEVQPEGDEK